jgi:hypothetical protein
MGVPSEQFDFLKGLGDSAKHTVLGLIELAAGKTMPSFGPTPLVPAEFGEWARQMREQGGDPGSSVMDPRSGAERAGRITGDVVTAALPAGRVATAARGLPLLVRAGAEALTSGTIGAAQGGDFTTNAALGAAGPVVGAGARAVSSRIAPANAVREAAVEFGRARGVPIDAGTATGNRAVESMQYVADNSLAGSLVAERAGQAQARALAGVGEDLAATGFPRTTSPYQAGTAMGDALEARVKLYGKDATDSYDALRKIESTVVEPVPIRVPKTDHATGKVTMDTQMVDMPMPVDLRTVKAQLKPVYDRMTRQMNVTQQRQSDAMHAIKNILDSDDFVPASVIDLDLSNIKGSILEVEGIGKTLGATAVRTLSTALDAAVAKGGPAAQQALAEGRKATVQKYAVKGLLDTLRDEPVQAFEQAIWKNDSGIDRLAAIAKEAPGAMPEVGRAYLDGIMHSLSTAASEGKVFQGGAGMWSKWDQLGPKTKAILFPDATHRNALDQFFQLSKQIGRNINPSGTGRAAIGLTQAGSLAFTEPVTGAMMILGLGGVSALLHSEVGAKALAGALKMPSSATRAGTSSGLVALMRAMQQTGVEFEKQENR